MTEHLYYKNGRVGEGENGGIREPEKFVRIK
jgi:hypothetical protein